MKTKIMGILNVTPDSFSDGGEFNNLDAALKRVEEMIQEGADIIDIGGESTRPGSEFISIQEEKDRVLPVVCALRKNFGEDVLISIDSNKSEVIQELLPYTIDIVNSLGGFSFDLKFAQILQNSPCSIVIYHTRGIPKTMQRGEIIYQDVIEDISLFLMSNYKLGKKME